MKDVVVYHHDPVEVDPRTSWTGLCSTLRGATYSDIRAATDSRVLDLFAYARPDAVITVAGSPVISIEQTAMNPSGHNIPQRFSCLARAAELGVPSVLYYPEFARRTFSDPNVRYAQVRVPLAQQRLSAIHGVPSLSLFWPTDATTLLPTTIQTQHVRIAQVVDAIIRNRGDVRMLHALPPIRDALDEMDFVVEKYSQRYRKNKSVRRYFPAGLPSSRTAAGSAIDPPASLTMLLTNDLIHRFFGERAGNTLLDEHAEFLHSRKYSLLFRTTANAAGTDSEHPWPGYLTLFDFLYARQDAGGSRKQRTFNLVYELPISAATFSARANQPSPPTATYIVDVFADLVCLQGGVVLGRPVRGNTPACVL